MGFLPGHTRRSQKGYTGGVRALEYFAEDTVRCALIGNSFHTTVVASLLSGQLRALGFAHVAVPPAVLTLRFMQELLDFEQSGRGRIVDELIDIQSHVVAPGALPAQLDPRINQEEEDALWGDFDTLFPDHRVPFEPTAVQRHAGALWLVEAHLRSSSSRGSEVRADFSLPMMPRPLHKTTIDTRRWHWRHVLASRVKKPRHHINRLELEGVDLAVRWRLRAKSRTRRCLHLVDSQVALSILTRGRTSSARLTPAVRRICSRLLASGLSITFAYVRSSLNPADEPSRK